MSLHEPQFAWFFWSLLLLGIWATIYALLKNRESRREMLIVSFWTSLFGLTEPLFVPAYWNPPSLFDLAHRTGFDIESLIFSFAMGGIAVVIYDRLFGGRHAEMPLMERAHPRHRYHVVALLFAPIIFLELLFSSINPIYAAVIALTVGGVLTWICRPDLKKKMVVSALLFLGLYFAYFLALIVAYPGYVEQVWNLPALSGILIAGIPLEELMLAISFGFFWSSIYEHIAWRKIKLSN